jgi:hypothetical protein
MNVNAEENIRRQMEALFSDMAALASPWSAIVIYCFYSSIASLYMSFSKVVPLHALVALG